MGPEKRAIRCGEFDSVRILRSWQNSDVGTKNMMRAEQCGYISLARALNTIGVERTLSDEQVEEKSEVVEELSKKLMEAATAGNQRSVFICLTKGADLEYQ